MFDAYTVKKVLPRLLIAVVLIQLSWFIFTGMINLTNAVAYGVEGLIYAPFKQSGAELTLGSVFTIITGASTTTGGATAGQAAAAGAGFAALAGGAGAIALGVANVGVIFAMAGTVILSLLIGFFVLVLRQVVILALLVISPIALVFWILPNTEKYWKLWWESFSKLLLMFPMILAMIAAGRAFGYVAAVSTSGTGGAENVIKMLIVFLGFFGPFFLIPKTFQLAGSMFANLTGMVNDRSRGGFDRLKNYRGRKAKEGYEKAKTGEYWSRNNAGARLANRIGIGVGAGIKGRGGFGQRGLEERAKITRDATMRNQAENASLKNFMLSNDDGGAVLALSGGTHAGARDAANELRDSWIRGGATQAEAQARADAALNAARAVGITKSNAGAALNMSMQNKARSIAAGEEGIQLVANGVQRLHGDNHVAMEETAQAAQYFARESGRSDIGGIWQFDPPATPGGAPRLNTARTLQDGFERAGAHKVAHGHTNDVRAHADNLVQRHQAALAAGDIAAATETAAQMTSLRNAMGVNTPDANKRIINDMLNRAGVDTTAARSTDQQFGAQLGNLAANSIGIGQQADAQLRPQLTEQATAEIRNRAGLYDAGRMTPEELRRQQESGEN